MNNTVLNPTWITLSFHPPDLLTHPGESVGGVLRPVSCVGTINVGEFVVIMNQYYAKEPL